MGDGLWLVLQGVLECCLLKWFWRVFWVAVHLGQRLHENPCWMGRMERATMGRLLVKRGRRGWDPW